MMLYRCLSVAFLCFVVGASLAGADGPNMIPNPGFEQGLDSWTASFGKTTPLIDDRPGSVHDGGKCLRVKIDGTVGGIDCARRFRLGEDVVRRKRYVLSAYLKNDGVGKGDFGLRLYFYDDAGGFAKMYSAMTLGPKSARFGWKKHTATFGAGTPRPIPRGAATCKVRFSLWDKSGVASCDVSIDDVSLTPDPTFVPVGRPATKVAAVWRDPNLGVTPATDPATVAALLKDAGFKTNTLTTDDLCSEKKLSAAQFGVLVLPYANVYPAKGGKTLHRFLADGGSFISLAGRAFSRPVFKVNGKWVAEDEARDTRLRIDDGSEWSLAQAGKEDKLEGAAAENVRGRPYTRFTTADLRAYAYAGVKVSSLGADAEMIVFDAKGDAATPFLCLEMKGKDGSRWKHVAPLHTEWAEYRVHMASFLSYASKGRGEGFDYIRPDKAATLWFGLTTGMVGKGPHGFDLANVRFCRAAVPSREAVRSQFAGSGGVLAQRFFGPQVRNERGTFPIDCFNEPRRFANATALQPADGQSLISLRGPIAGRFSGWTVTGAAEAAKTKARHRSPFAGESRTSLCVPLLEAVDAQGEAVGPAAALIIHHRGQYAGGVWAAFGLDSMDLSDPGNGPLRGALTRVAGFISSGIVCGDARPAFVAGPGGVTMGVELALFNRGASPAELRTETHLASGKVKKTQTRRVTLPADAWTRATVLKVAAKDFDWQKFAVRGAFVAKGSPILNPEFSLSLDTVKALRDVGDFFVKQGADDGKFMGYSFVDHRAARGLLGAYEILGDDKHRQTAVNWGLAMIEEQREDGGYRMGYGITPKGEACYVADGGEIALGTARIVRYTSGPRRERFMKSVRTYMGYRDSFRCEGGGIGVGWCLNDYGQRPIPKLDKPTRIYAPERNTYTIGCTLAAAYAYARLTGDPKDERAAERDADWLMKRASTLTGAFIESYMYAHALTTSAQRRKRYEDFVKRAFVDRMVSSTSPWWLGGGGRAAVNLNGLTYCFHKLESPDLAGNPRIRAKMMEATYAMFGLGSPHSAYKLIAKDRLKFPEWIYLCFSYVGLPDVIRPMVTMKPFEPAR